MADDPSLYRARAVIELANAEATSLDNVRDRCERSAKAWTKMADQAQRTLDLRVAREAATVSARNAMLASAEE